MPRRAQAQLTIQVGSQTHVMVSGCYYVSSRNKLSCFCVYEFEVSGISRDMGRELGPWLKAQRSNQNASIATASLSLGKIKQGKDARGNF